MYGASARAPSHGTDFTRRYATFFSSLMRMQPQEDEYFLRDDPTELRNLDAIWYSVKNDRSQRQMIRAVLKSKRSNLGGLAEDVGWLLKEVDLLAEVRNDVIHAPLLSMDDKDGTPSFLELSDPPKPKVRPFAAEKGHPRSLNLLSRDLLSEYSWCRDAARVLTDFCINCCQCLYDYGRFPWPTRPQLPTRRGEVTANTTRG